MTHVQWTELDHRVLIQIHDLVIAQKIMRYYSHSTYIECQVQLYSDLFWFLHSTNKWRHCINTCAICLALSLVKRDSWFLHVVIAMLISDYCYPIPGLPICFIEVFLFLMSLVWFPIAFYSLSSSLSAFLFLLTFWGFSISSFHPLQWGSQRTKQLTALEIYQTNVLNRVRVSLCHRLAVSSFLSTSQTSNIKIKRKVDIKRDQIRNTFYPLLGTNDKHCKAHAHYTHQHEYSCRLMMVQGFSVKGPDPETSNEQHLKWGGRCKGLDLWTSMLLLDVIHPGMLVRSCRALQFHIELTTQFVSNISCE